MDVASCSVENNSPVEAPSSSFCVGDGNQDESKSCVTYKLNRKGMILAARK